MLSLYHYSWRGGSGDTICGEMKTGLNDVIREREKDNGKERREECRRDPIGHVVGWWEKEMLAVCPLYACVCDEEDRLVHVHLC